MISNKTYIIKHTNHTFFESNHKHILKQLGVWSLTHLKAGQQMKVEENKLGANFQLKSTRQNGGMASTFHKWLDHTCISSPLNTLIFVQILC